MHSIFQCIIPGFEGLTIDPLTNTLYAMLQSATIQDGGDDKSTSRFTRLLAYDIASPLTSVPLIGEWIVPFPQSGGGNTEACSEIHFLGNGTFLALSRDGDGRGGSDNKSSYKYKESSCHRHSLHTDTPTGRQISFR